MGTPSAQTLVDMGVREIFRELEEVPLMTMVGGFDVHRKQTASITKSARETPSVHHVGMPAKRWMLGRHGKWAVDVVSCRDHREVRQGVCEGAEGGQGSDFGSGGGCHRLVA